uniref:Phospholysine phosphohistidine inorganic pyrophosphate phosphatase n=1 Tax=Catharus ustulatus TaxID=91951 RepID=A0A8C3UKP3_CATUS
MAGWGWGWARAVRGLLLDVSGVLYDSGADGGAPIAGSAEAVRRIKASGLKLQLCTNETQATRADFVRKLRAMGFDVSVAEVTAPAPAACRLLQERGLRPHLLVHHDLVPEFAEIDKTNPNCVVLGDAAEHFTYANLNEAFRLLIGMEKPVLISLGKGRYYKETDGLKLDVGAYMKALEYACDIEAEVVGKPAKSFFESALAELGVPAEQAVMIGDDIVSDVGGAQQCGMRALQVRTGKYSRGSSGFMEVQFGNLNKHLGVPLPGPWAALVVFTVTTVGTGDGSTGRHSPQSAGVTQNILLPLGSAGEEDLASFKRE